jgi:sensor c-di-GMP phosphodiesterase-like protein
MLLETSGELIHSSTSLSSHMISGHMLQVQRLNTMPWSVALLEQKSSLFAAGVKDFFWHWLTYLGLLGMLLAFMQYRYRRRTLSAFRRLLVHTDRLFKGQMQGVRHVPEGWRELFDRICELARRAPSE